MATHLHSAPNSQASSLEDSNASQGLYQRPTSSDNTREAVQREPTPSTSLSNPSSQEQIQKAVLQSPPTRGQRIETHNSAQAPIAPMLHMTGDIGGAKRTADGQVKERSPTSPMSVRYEHSRNSSTTSRGSQIGELSSQLKTRLSYAMVKVQNGWESRNLSELETLTSNSARTSPAISPITASLHPPRSRPTFSTTQSTVVDRPIFAQSPRRTDNAQQHYHTGASDLDHAFQQPRRSPVSAEGSRTYESFWREHSDPSLHSQPANAYPSLAPAADIMSRHERPQPQPPRLQTTNNPPSSYCSPSTPSHSSYARPKPRTPSQNAAMEKDAVETLVFMSSPNNSGYSRPQRSEQLLGTSLKNQVGERSKIMLANKGVRSINGAGRRAMTDGDVDRILDEDSEGESSSEGG